MVPSTFSARAAGARMRFFPPSEPTLKLTGDFNHVKVVSGHELDSNVRPVPLGVLAPHGFCGLADLDDGGSIGRRRVDIGTDESGDGGEQGEDGED